jgi:hypothetical protein
MTPILARLRREVCVPVSGFSGGVILLSSIVLLAYHRFEIVSIDLIPTL